MKSFASAFRSRYTRSLEDRAARLDPDVRRELADEIESTMTIGDAQDPGGSPRPGGEVADRRGGGGADAEADEAIAELDAALEESRERLAKFVDAERFVGTRVASYRRALDDRRARLDGSGGRRGGGGGADLTTDEGTAADSFDDEVGDGGGGGGGGAGSVEAPPAPIEGEEEQAFREKLGRDEEALGKVALTHRGILEDVERMRRCIADLESKRKEILERRDECRDFLVAAALAEETEAGGGAGGLGGCPLMLPSSGREHASTVSHRDVEGGGSAVSAKDQGNGVRRRNNTSADGGDR